MPPRTQVAIPTLVRIKPGALDRVGIYLRRERLERVWLLRSAGLPATIPQRLLASLEREGVDVGEDHEIEDASFEEASDLLARIPSGTRAVVGLGGGKALDTAKYLAHLAGLPYLAAPTSLSNDGFASPSASLTLGGRRRSLPSAMPFGVVVDTDVALGAPVTLWLSGVGDLVAKLTAVRDWKLAFHATGELVNDFAALLSDATVHQMIARGERDEEGVRLLASALMLNGIAIGVAGSSRPASGSEHLISHALDAISARPRLHGLQVGVATYLMSRLQQQLATDDTRDADPNPAGNPARIGRLFERSGFWHAIRDDPFDRAEWLEALRVAPMVKPGFHTVLSERDWSEDYRRLIDEAAELQGCFQ